MTIKAQQKFKLIYTIPPSPDSELSDMSLSLKLRITDAPVLPFISGASCNSTQLDLCLEDTFVLED
jgi:hypothetical protein